MDEKTMLKVLKNFPWYRWNKPMRYIKAEVWKYNNGTWRLVFIVSDIRQGDIHELEKFFKYYEVDWKLEGGDGVIEIYFDNSK